ncbi:MAG: hypothetical protein IPN26_11155 [Bacteroidetes bacterium]|nr:hypothetical protein [Bacteroidota bacterium]
MKCIVYLLLLLLTSNLTYATIVRCNNNPLVTGPNVYSNAQSAHDAANAGDTIHLEPTTFGSYGQIQVYKKITIISIGDFLENNPGLQVGTISSRVSDIFINPGADSCKISCYVDNSIYVYANATIVQKARATTIYTDNVSNTQIKQSFVQSIFGSNAPNLLMNNCYIWGWCHITGNYGAIVQNNIIRVSQFTYGWSSNFENSIIANNIFWTENGGDFYFTNCSFSNNICDISSLPAGFSNENAVDMSSVFLNWNNFNGDHFELNPSYPKQNIGIYAGNYPYIPGIQPAIPSIYFLQAEGINSGNNLQIQVSTRSN